MGGPGVMGIWLIQRLVMAVMWIVAIGLVMGT